MVPTSVKLALILMIMVSLVTMTVSTAQAGFAKSACSSQLQVADMCYAVATPAAQADVAKKPAPCCDLVLQDDPIAQNDVSDRDFVFMSKRVSSAVSHPMVPLRPPCAA